MTNEEAMKQIKVIKVFMGYDKDNPIVQKAQEALDMAIKALEQEPCEDCISRTELLSRIDAERKYLLNFKMDGAEHIIVHHARRIIEDMPSVTPQPKMGRWIAYTDHQACSCCGNWIAYYENDFNFCPNCGAKMEVSE